MSSNRVAVISVNKLDRPITFQPRPTFSAAQHKKPEDKRQLARRRHRKLRCERCGATFSPENNPRGSCNTAPEKTEMYIAFVTCVCCLHAIAYHCFSDSENEYDNPCSCDTSDELNCKKWTTFSILTICLPCMLFYWPLKACQKIFKTCGCCGGRHYSSRSETVLDVI